MSRPRSCLPPRSESTSTAAATTRRLGHSLLTGQCGGGMPHSCFCCAASSGPLTDGTNHCDGNRSQQHCQQHVAPSTWVSGSTPCVMVSHGVSSTALRCLCAQVCALPSFAPARFMFVILGCLSTCLLVMVPCPSIHRLLMSRAPSAPFDCFVHTWLPFLHAAALPCISLLSFVCSMISWYDRNQSCNHSLSMTRTSPDVGLADPECRPLSIKPPI